MVELSSILARMTDLRRASAMAGLVVLVMLHVSAAAHQFEHIDDHGPSVCEACSAYSQLEDSSAPEVPSIEIPVVQVSEDLLASDQELPPATAAAFRSRAPPLS